MVTADTRYQFVSHFISSRRSFLRFNGTVDRRGGRTVTITLKFYTGMQITYTNVEASQHSGGKI